MGWTLNADRSMRKALEVSVGMAYAEVGRETARRQQGFVLESRGKRGILAPDLKSSGSCGGESGVNILDAMKEEGGSEAVRPSLSPLASG